MGIDMDFTQWTGAFSRIQDRIANPSSLLARIGAELVPAFQQNINEGGYPLQFKALATSTILDRARQGYAEGPPLKRSGALYNRMRYAVGTGYVDVGSSGPQDRRQYYGYAGGNGKPATAQRNPLVIRAAVAAQIERLAITYMVGALH